MRSSSYDRLVNNSKRSFGEMLSRASLGDNLVIQFTAFRRKVLRVARKASRSVRLSCALGRQRDALLKIGESGPDYFSRSECFLCLDSPSALTRIALKPLTGHSCSQIPQPVHRSGSTRGVWSRTCRTIFFKSEVLSSGGTCDSRMMEFCEFERI